MSLRKSVLVKSVLAAVCLAAFGMAVPQGRVAAWENVCPQPYMNWIVTATCRQNRRAAIETTVAARDSAQAIRNAQVSRAWPGGLGGWAFSARIASF